LISVVPAGHPHSIECSRPADTLRLTLGITAFQGDAGRPVERRMPLMGPRWAILDPFMRATGNALRKDLATHGNLPATFLASLAHVLAMHITARYASVSAEAVDPPGLPSHKLVRVRAFIDDHLHTAISVHQLATVIHMSPFHFARMFKKATGSTPHAYLTLRRMQRSQQLLRDTRLPLVDIAAQVGFQTQGHFTVVFHRQVGVTPWAFRREQNAPAALLRSELARTARDCAEARKTRQRVSH
jgi:AraC family transcriptional regulator